MLGAVYGDIIGSYYEVYCTNIAFLQSNGYESAVRNAASLGGDADTMACIAGDIAEAYYGEIPRYIRTFCDSRLDSSLRSVFREFEYSVNIP